MGMLKMNFCLSRLQARLATDLHHESRLKFGQYKMRTFIRIAKPVPPPFRAQS